MESIKSFQVGHSVNHAIASNNVPQISFLFSCQQRASGNNGKDDQLLCHQFLH